MNFTAFRYFNELSRVGSVRRAADRLHVAPSAVSRQIAQLEHTLGIQLMERTTAGVNLTPAGMILERYTRTMFRDLDRVQAAIEDIKGLKKGHVTLWVMEGLISGFLPRVVAGFSARYPDIQFTVASDSTDRITEALIRDEADIGIIFNGRRRPEIQVVAEHVEPVMCLVTPTHAFAERTSVSLAEVCAQPLSLPFMSFGLRQIFDEAAERRQLRPQVVLNANTIELTKAMALSERTVTVAPALAAMREIQLGWLVAVPIDAEELSGVRSSLCIHRDRPLSYAAREFVKVLTAEFAKIGSAD